MGLQVRYFWSSANNNDADELMFWVICDFVVMTLY